MENYNEMLNNLRELVNNPTPRIAVELCLDVSSSMSGQPIRELQQGLQQYVQEIGSDDLTRYSAETAIITFGSDVECAADFSTVDNLVLPELMADGMTRMGEALELAMDRLEERKKLYQKGGIDYYQPILVVMTDGEPNGDPVILKQAIQRICDAVSQRKLTVIAVGLGEDANMEMLERLCVKGHPLQFSKLRFREFFAWLSQSVACVSASVPGEETPLDLSGLEALAAEPWPETLL